MTRNGPMPLALYHQIYMVLREKLLAGEFPPNQAIPSELALAELYEVSRVTIRATLEKLEKEGLISREKGRGTFPIAPKPLVSDPVPSDMRGFLDSLVQLGLRTTVEVVEFEYLTPSAAIAARLGLGPAGVVLHTARIYSFKGTPFGYVHGYMREEIGRTLTKPDVERGPTLPLMERAGLQVVRVEQLVTSRLADPQIAGFLKVPMGSALTLMERLTFDKGERAVDLNIGVYRPDRYMFQLNLVPPTADEPAQWQDGRGTPRPKPKRRRATVS